MAPQEDPLVSRVQASYQKLANAANTLNIISDELGKVIVVLDSALKYLNLGIVAWVDIRIASDDIGNTYTDQVGYSKIDGKWGISIRSFSQDSNSGQFTSEDEWLFSDAPRSLRLLAIEKIPDLLEQLVEDTGTTIKKITSSLSKSQMLAAVISDAAKQAQRAKQHQKS